MIRIKIEQNKYCVCDLCLFEWRPRKSVDKVMPVKCPNCMKREWNNSGITEDLTKEYEENRRLNEQVKLLTEAYNNLSAKYNKQLEDYYLKFGVK